jgi:hypothetical protein
MQFALPLQGRVEKIGSISAGARCRKGNGSLESKCFQMTADLCILKTKSAAKAIWCVSCILIDSVTGAALERAWQAECLPQ